MSYVRFQGEDKLVSASTDSTLRLWSLTGQGPAEAVYDGHINDKNFVGLSAEGDLLACGSETNEVGAPCHVPRGCDRVSRLHRHKWSAIHRLP